MVDRYAPSFSDERFMAAAIRLALRHRGLTAENPSVGALIIAGSGEEAEIVGCGVTASGGRPHAERMALAEAGIRAQGATAYVTLEPCAHYGNTPPCAEALITAGIKRVVIGAVDPDIRVAGKGISRMKDAGIEVVAGVLAEDARDSLSAYLCRKEKGRAEVTLKLAISADDKIGRKGQGNIVITGPVSHAQTHIMRAENDAIAVGINTVLADDPMLDCRLPGLEQRSPIRIILDSLLRLPLASRLVTTAKSIPVWVFCVQEAPVERKIALEAAGCRVINMEDNGMGKLCPSALLTFLAHEGVSSVLLEGGSYVARSFWEQGMVDQLALFQSDLIIGVDGYAAPSFGAQMNQYVNIRSQQFGVDQYREWKRIA